MHHLLFKLSFYAKHEFSVTTCQTKMQMNYAFCAFDAAIYAHHPPDSRCNTETSTWAYCFTNCAWLRIPESRFIARGALCFIMNSFKFYNYFRPYAFVHCSGTEIPHLRCTACPRYATSLLHSCAFMVGATSSHSATCPKKLLSEGMILSFSTCLAIYLYGNNCECRANAPAFRAMEQIFISFWGLDVEYRLYEIDIAIVSSKHTIDVQLRIQCMPIGKFVFHTAQTCHVLVVCSHHVLHIEWNMVWTTDSLGDVKWAAPILHVNIQDKMRNLDT